jgi:hypothetical protein
VFIGVLILAKGKILVNVTILDEEGLICNKLVY